ncbi:MAG: ShlB/FhaC/HecB family hemolysin secretion/activation protein [Myxococcota bacterium]
MTLRALAAVLLVLASGADAQTLRPGDERPELPEPAPTAPEAEPHLALPPLPEAQPDTLDAGLSVVVQRFDVVGSTVFGAEALGEALAPWLGRAISSEELLAARDAVTALYHDAGYVTSGAVVPDQDVDAGVVAIQVVEGWLDEVSVRGNRRFRALYFEQRLRRAGSAPVNLARLEHALQILQRDPWIERVDARLEPGERFGASRLVLAVEEARPWHARAAVANDHSPTIGEIGPEGSLRVANLLGMGDVWTGRAEFTEGLRDLEAAFEVPITPWDTRLGVRFRDTHTEIVERPFEDLDIEASSQTWAVSLAHPVHRGETDSLWVELIGERRESESRVFGSSFCFELTDPDCDEPTATIVRGAATWTRRTRSDVFALRSQLSVGVDALGATLESDRSVPDGRFVAWLAQAQWAHVLPESLRSTRAVLRGDLQLADETLLSIEKFAMGGQRSVRGYRENQLVRDSGYVLSGELRVPVWRDSLRRPLLELVPFMDFAQGWNQGDSTFREELWSAGAGLRWMPRDGVLAEVFYGAQLDEWQGPSDSLQDDGIHFRIEIDAPTVF